MVHLLRHLHVQAGVSVGKQDLWHTLLQRTQHLEVGLVQAVCLGACAAGRGGGKSYQSYQSYQVTGWCPNRVRRVQHEAGGKHRQHGKCDRQRFLSAERHESTTTWFIQFKHQPLRIVRATLIAGSFQCMYY